MKAKFKILLILYLQFILISACATFQGSKAGMNLSEGFALYDKSDYENAILFFKKCIADDENNSTCHFWIGKALLERGKEDDLKAVLIEFKDAINLANEKEKVLALIRSAFFERADKYSQKGDSYMESRCYLAYTENFNKDDVDSYVKLGKIMLDQGNQIAAAYYAKKAYAIEPKNESVGALLQTLSTP